MLANAETLAIPIRNPTERMTLSIWIQFIAAAATIALLLAAAFNDLARYRIPNWIVYAIVAAFAIGAAFNFAWPAIIWPVVAGVVVFLIGAGLFALGMFGGGDVKLIAAMALWTGFADLPRFLLVMGVAGGLLGFAWLLKRRRQHPAMASNAAAARPDASTSEASQTPPKSPNRIPYGVAIALAGFDFFISGRNSPLTPVWPWMQ
jgi:prepilin peptidase CpaA